MDENRRQYEHMTNDDLFDAILQMDRSDERYQPMANEIVQRTIKLAAQDFFNQWLNEIMRSPDHPASIFMENNTKAV